MKAPHPAQIELTFDDSQQPQAGDKPSPDGSSHLPKPKGYNIEEAIAVEWHLPLGENVTLWMKNTQGSLTGRLELADIPQRIDRTHPLQLRINGQRISSREIDSWSLNEA